MRFWFSVYDDFYHSNAACPKLRKHVTYVYQNLDDPRRSDDSGLMYEPCKECVK